MRYLFLLCFTLTFCSESGGLQPTNRPSQPEDKEIVIGNKLVWSDEFDTPGAPDDSKWTYDLGGSGWGNNELQYYTNDPKNVRVEDGNLVIEAIKEKKDNNEYTSTRIISKGKGDWKYGRIEIRAQLPLGRGTWPAIWMLPTDWKYGGWPDSGEIDIMEHVGYDQGVVHGNLHSKKYNHILGTNVDGKTNVSTASSEFHIYAIEWTNKKIDFFVDTKRYHSISRKSGDGWEGWPFDERFHLLMNIAVGGNWGGAQGVDETIWPQKMLVDYVRVYQ